VSNFPLSYKVSWLPRLLKPSLSGNDGMFGPAEARWHGAKAVVRLVFLGDISAVANSEPPEIDPALREIISPADLVVANCESPVVERPAFPLSTRLGVRHAMTPSFLDGVLAAAGIAPDRLVLSLANNHALDQGVEGFAETVVQLDELGIRTIGTASDGPVRYVEAAPLRLGFTAFTQWRNADATDFAGRVTMMKDALGWSGKPVGIDLLCAVPHWDFEFRHFPQTDTRILARRLAAGGASLIVGGHAHVVQPVEQIGEALVAYGLGDFLGTAHPRTPWPFRIGALLAVEVSADAKTKGKITAYRVVPFLRERRRRHERLVPLEADDLAGRRAMRRIAAIFSDPGGGQGTRKSL
jgi:poly-gamma-glutamate capsule biosynthesis protein CapA/YwtB (metallophosphatase superfamily)